LRAVVETDGNVGHKEEESQISFLEEFALVKKLGLDAKGGIEGFKFLKKIHNKG
jgi:hypothetical protein